ncbi:MAG: tetratricopeptide repeat protein, partial [Leptospiraceae bacterium]|nr:tetratricopeptide repeat protein [Leptospiraceae bacterium]
VHFFKMEPGDVIIMGSDGRDDIDMTPDEPVRTINEDEFLFLKRVEESDGDLDGLVNSINAQGVITDDLSLLKLGFKVDQRVRSSAQDDFVEDADRVVIDIDVHDEGPAIAAGDSDFDELFHKGRELAREGRHQDALDVLNRAYEINPDNPSLNRIMGVLTFKGQDYERAVEILNRYLEMDASVVDFWLYLSIAHKRTGDLDRALTAARKVAELDPNRVINLINLADIHSKLGDRDTARQYVDRALELDPGNRQAQSLMSGIS